MPFRAGGTARITKSKPRLQKSSESTAAQTVTASSERRLMESADQAQLLDVSPSQADSQITCDFLFALKVCANHKTSGLLFQQKQ